MDLTTEMEPIPEQTSSPRFPTQPSTPTADITLPEPASLTINEQETSLSSSDGATTPRAIAYVRCNALISHR